MAEINWTRESETWLEDIYYYIAADDAEAAEQTITNIYEKAQLLTNHPRLGYIDTNQHRLVNSHSPLRALPYNCGFLDGIPARSIVESELHQVL